MDMECYFCKGTGVYKGTMEPEGIGVICNYCNATGKLKLSAPPLNAVPFSGRKTRDDVRLVYKEVGELRGIYPGTPVTYQEFLNGKMPE